MLQSTFMLEQLSRQWPLARVADANRLRVRALLQIVRQDRKAPVR